MKRAVVLHGTDANPSSNWFPWLKKELEGRQYEVWIPALPGADAPSARVYKSFLLTSSWDFQGNLVIGHSSGAVAILSLLQHLPNDIQVDTAVFCGSFTEDLAKDPGWTKLRGLFEEPFDFELIKTKANKFLFLHGDNDPHCPIEQAQYLSRQTGGELVIVPGGQHFSASLDPVFVQFPQLITALEERKLL